MSSLWLYMAIRGRTGGPELYYIYYWVTMQPSYLNCLNIMLHSKSLSGLALKQKIVIHLQLITSCSLLHIWLHSTLWLFATDWKYPLAWCLPTLHCSHSCTTLHFIQRMSFTPPFTIGLTWSWRGSINWSQKRDLNLFLILQEQHKFPNLKVFHYLQGTLFFCMYGYLSANLDQITMFKRLCSSDPCTREVISQLHLQLLSKPSTSPSTYVGR